MAGQQHSFPFFPPPHGGPTQWQPFAAQTPANPYSHQPPPIPGMPSNNPYHPTAPPISQMHPSLPGLGGFTTQNPPRFPPSSSVPPPPPPPPPPPMPQNPSAHQPYPPFASNPNFMQHRPMSSHVPHQAYAQPPIVPAPGLTPGFQMGPGAKDEATAGGPDNQNHWSAQSHQRKKPPTGPRNGAPNHGKSSKNNKQKRPNDAQFAFNHHQNVAPPRNLPVRPSQGQIDQQKAFVKMLVDHDYGFKELVADALALDPDRLLQLFREMGLATSENAPKPTNALPAPKASDAARSVLPGLNSVAAQASPMPTPAQPGPMDRKDYIARLMAAKGKKGTPPEASEASPATLASDSLDPAAKRKADLARLRAEALQSARAAKAAREAREREAQTGQQSQNEDPSPSDSSASNSGQQSSEMRMAYANPQSLGAPAPISASRLPGLFMTGPWDQAGQEQTAEGPNEWITQDAGSSRPRVHNPDEIQIEDVEEDATHPMTQQVGSTASGETDAPQGRGSPHDGRELRLKEQKLLEVKKRLELMEARKRAKIASQRVKSKQTAQDKATQGTLTPASVQPDVLSPAPEQRVADATLESELTPQARPSQADGGMSTPEYMTPQPSLPLKLTAPNSRDTPQAASARKRKREEIESDLSAQRIQSQSTLSKMELLKTQMRELEEAVRKEQELKAELTKELEELGVNTDNVPDSELQATRDHVVANLDAEQAIAPIADTAMADPALSGQASSADVAIEQAAPAPMRGEGMEQGTESGFAETQSRHADDEGSDSGGSAMDEGSASDPASADQGVTSGSPSGASEDDGLIKSSSDAADEEDLDMDDAEAVHRHAQESDTAADAPSPGAADSDSDDSFDYDPAPAELTGREEGEEEKVSEQDTPSGEAASDGVSEDGELPEQATSALAHAQGDGAAPAETEAVARPPNPFASSSESGEISDSDEPASPKQLDEAGHLGSNDDHEEYEPQETSASGYDARMPDVEMDEDDYEPPEASPSVGTPANVVGFPTNGDSGVVMLDEHGHGGYDPFAQTAAPVADDDAQELQPSQPNAPAEIGIRPVSAATHESYRPYRNPLHAFKDYRFHPDYAASTPGGYQSLTYSNAIDPRTPLCPVEASGETCHDSMCAFQHFGSMKLTGEQVILQLATDNPGRTEDEQRAFRKGLTAVLQEQHAQGNQDPERVSALIAAYRREFAEDPTRSAGGAPSRAGEDSGE